MSAVVGIVSGCGLGIHTHCRNCPSKSELVLYKPLIHGNSRLKQL